MAKTPGLSLTIVLTLAVGIGGATTVYDVANVFHWRAPAIKDARHVVEVYTTSRQPAFAGPHGPISWADYEDYRDASTSFEGLAAFTQLWLDLEPPLGAEQTAASAVTGNFFEVLGLEPVLGRLLRPEDDRLGGEPLVVLSYASWLRLGADAGVIGQPVRLSDKTFYVIGVAPATFTGTQAGVRPAFFLPAHQALESFGFPRDARTDRTYMAWEVLGRLVDGRDRRSAASELAVIAERLDREHPAANLERRIAVLPVSLGHPVDQFRLRATLRIFGAAVGLLLLIVCANVANMLLSKAGARRREMGIRQSLGANRPALLRQLLGESGLLAIAGGAVGLLVALSLRRVLSLDPELLGDMRFDTRVLGLTMMTVVAATVVFGLAPALATSQVDLVAALKDSMPGAGGRRRYGGRSLLAITQVALSLVLLVSTALLTSNLRDLKDVDRGFDHDNLLLARVDVGKATPEEGRRLFRRLRERSATIPGVSSVGMPLLVPPFMLDGNERLLLPEDPETVHTARFNRVDDGYFSTLGLALQEGRLFGPQDAGTKRRVVVVNRLLAERLWPGESALGRTVKVDRARPGDSGTDYEVIGVVSSVAWHILSREPEPVIYYSWEQRYRSSLHVLLRTEGVDPQGVFATLRRELAALDPGLTLSDTITHEDLRWQSLLMERMQARTLNLFGAAGVLISLIGVFSVMSYTVSQQTHEIGIRMAIGARRADVARWVLRRGLILNMAGIVVGLLGSFWAIKLLQQVVAGVVLVDPLVIAGAIALLLVASMAAVWLPARRASGLDPLAALRQE